MATSQNDKILIEEAIETGLQNRWYAVLPSWAVSSTPIGVTRLEENIVLWRDEQGTVQAIEDRCPHRGARLSLGWNLGNRLSCWYHGVEVDNTGTVADVPAIDSCPLIGKKTCKSYPAMEVRGAILLYFGDEQHTAPADLEFPDQLVSDEWDSLLCVAKWHCNYRYAIENVMDPMHGAYLHAQSHSMAGGDRKAEMRATKTSNGFIFEKVGQRDVNFDWVELGETGATWLRLEIPYQASAGPGGNFGIIGMATPVDKENTLVFFWRTRKVSGWQRDVWRFMYRTKLEKLHWDVLEQDRIVLENLAPNARDQESLYQHDAGITRMRRLQKDAARAQLEALGKIEPRHAG